MYNFNMMEEIKRHLGDISKEDLDKAFEEVNKEFEEGNKP